MPPDMDVESVRSTTGLTCYTLGKCSGHQTTVHQSSFFSWPKMPSMKLTTTREVEQFITFDTNTVFARILFRDVADWLRGRPSSDDGDELMRLGAVGRLRALFAVEVCLP